mgnify:CR=1 FL=1|jgi:hypothetical protein
MSRMDPVYSHVDPIYQWRKRQRDLSESYPVTPNNEWFQNEYGMYRWHLIRAGYWDGIINEDVVTDLFIDWRDTPEYFMLDGEDIEGNVVISAFVKASKRGNDVYKDKVNHKFGFFDRLEPIEFFDDSDKHRSTPMLFVTLTVDPKLYSLKEAWSFIGEELNRFETLLRQKYGKFVKFRVWESHESGYPHSHIVYYFHKTTFKLWEHWSSAEDRSFRLIDKDRDSIKRMWSMGNLDIQGIQDTIGAFNEVKKYVTKVIWSDKGDKTNAMLTLFHKQSYRISLCDPFNQPLPPDIVNESDLLKRDQLSRLYLSNNVEKWAKKDFIGSVWGVNTYIDFYKRLHEQNETLVEPGLSALVAQTMSNYNIEIPEIVKWRFVGFILGADLFSFLPQNVDKWVFGIKDPPPELYACVNIPEVY